MLSHYTKKWTKMSTTPLYKKCCPTIHVVHNQTQSKKNVVHIAHDRNSKDEWLIKWQSPTYDRNSKDECLIYSKDEWLIYGCESCDVNVSIW